jgi:hypothetical protein
VGEVCLTVVPWPAAGSAPSAPADGPTWDGEAAWWAGGAAGGWGDGDNEVGGGPVSVLSESLLFTVRDTGIGISADGRRKLFNRFSQARVRVV